MTQEAALSTEVWKEHNLNGADSEGGRQNGGDAEASINDIKHSPPAQHVIVPDPPRHSLSLYSPPPFPHNLPPPDGRRGSSSPPIISTS